MRRAAKTITTMRVAKRKKIFNLEERLIPPMWMRCMAKAMIAHSVIMPKISIACHRESRPVH